MEEKRIREEAIPCCDCHAIHREQVEAAGRSMPEDPVLYSLADFFKTLGDGTRIRILWALDTGELCVCDLAALLGMTKSAVSHQLKALRQAKLIKYRKEGKNVFYSLDDDHVRDVIEKALEHVAHC